MHPPSIRPGDGLRVPRAGFAFAAAMPENEQIMTRIVRILILTCVGVFLAQMLFAATGRGFAFDYLLSLHGDGIRRGWVWQLISYQFLHANLVHLFFNMYGLYMFGSSMEREMGGRRFLALYLVSGVLGGVGFVLIEPLVPCIGASASVFGILAAFATIYPRVSISLLFPPVTLPAWQFVSILAGMDLVYMVTGIGGHIAYAAHVAGALAGFVYTMMWSGRWPSLFDRFHWRPRLRMTRPPPLPRTGFPDERGSPRVDPAEVDRILDKISRDGWSALTDAERRTLDRSSREMKSR